MKFRFTRAWLSFISILTDVFSKRRDGIIYCDTASRTVAYLSNQNLTMDIYYNLFAIMRLTRSCKFLNLSELHCNLKARCLVNWSLHRQWINNRIDFKVSNVIRITIEMKLTFWTLSRDDPHVTDFITAHLFELA